MPRMRYVFIVGLCDQGRRTVSPPSRSDFLDKPPNIAGVMKSLLYLQKEAPLTGISKCLMYELSHNWPTEDKSTVVNFSYNYPACAEFLLVFNTLTGSVTTCACPLISNYPLYRTGRTLHTSGIDCSTKSPNIGIFVNQSHSPTTTQVCRAGTYMYMHTCTYVMVCPPYLFLGGQDERTDACT